MSIEQLHSWLLDEGIRDELAKLSQATVRAELANLAPLPSELGQFDFDWPRLLLAGSILARSTKRVERDAALRIATGALTFGGRIEFEDAGALLMSKLSNNMARRLAEKRDLLTEGLEHRLGAYARVEEQWRRIDHAVLKDSSGQWLEVNDFQRQLWNAASGNGWLSASAPTASGKTFLVLEWLEDQLATNAVDIAVYLAPTRALVSEIEANLNTMLGDNKDVRVSSMPLLDIFIEARQQEQKQVYVLTQERLHLLANVVGDQLKIDLLLVDEAHKIGDKNRGVILQDAIERASRLNPKMRAVFMSPATQNPEALLSDAPENSQKRSVSSDIPTVLQNLILAEQVKRKPKEWELSLRTDNGLLPIGILNLQSSPTGARKKLAFIAAAAGMQGGTLVYVNGAAESEAVASLIAQLLPDPPAVDEDLAALADLARKGVHPKFQLAPLVEKGVAFHFGNMPSLIRLEVERLFKAGKIKFLVCTSTLVEGVNLSCRTIVLRGPKKGMRQHMEAHDFWNLAGRAGRWGNEFQGNIICIEPNDETQWPEGVPTRAQYPIERESDRVLGYGDDLINYLQQRESAKLEEVEGAERFEQVGAYLLTTFMRAKSIRQEPFAARHAESTILKLEEVLGRLADKVQLDVEVAMKHPGVSPLGLQQLLDTFKAYEGDVENLLPAAVDSFDSYDRFVTIMRRINQSLYPAFVPSGIEPLHALIVVQWLKGFSLSTMIRRNIDYHVRNKKKFELPALIRNTMELVEQIARFRAPKYLSAYVDVLGVFLKEQGREELVDDGVPIGTQLEFGVSSRTLLSLIELGVSRMSAVTLYERIARDDLSKEQVKNWVQSHYSQFEALEIPLIVAREISDKVLSSDSTNAQSDD